MFSHGGDTLKKEVDYLLNLISDRPYIFNLGHGILPETPQQNLTDIISYIREKKLEYQLVKSFHIIAIIAWMAGLLYLPRLYVYHSLVEIGSVRSQTFKLMERRLLKIIMNPAMIISWLLGLYLIFLNPSLLQRKLDDSKNYLRDFYDLLSHEIWTHKKRI